MNDGATYKADRSQDASIRVTGVNQIFGSGDITIHVLHDIDLELYGGELTLLMGPSGSGKSTLLANLSGLLRPSSGRVFTHAKDLWALTDEEIDRFRLAHCGFVFQGFNLFNALTALQQVMLILGYAGVPEDQIEPRAKKALQSVGLGNRFHLRPIELSGGEKQRVAIARALVKEPTLIFADEPTSALDSKNGQVMIDLLHKAARERNATVLTVTHDNRLLPHADRILQIEDGRIVSDKRGTEITTTTIKE